jgi:hypothetical protein
LKGVAMINAIKADMAILISREFLLLNLMVGAPIFGWLLGSCRRMYLNQVDGKQTGRFSER